MESDLSHAIAWVSNRMMSPWKFYFHLNEIRDLSSSLNVVLCHEVRSSNSMADVLAKQGHDRKSSWVALVI